MPNPVHMCSFMDTRLLLLLHRTILPVLEHSEMMNIHTWGLLGITLGSPSTHTSERRNSASGPEKWKEFYSAMQVKAVSTWLGVARCRAGLSYRATLRGLVLRSSRTVIPDLCSAHLDVSVWSKNLFPCWDTPPSWTEMFFGITWLGLSLHVEVLLRVRPSVLQPSPSGVHRCTDTSTYQHCDLLAAKFPAKVLER